MINLILKLMENEALKTAFLKLANMSISASWLVLAILVLRLVLKKAPKWVNVLLWGIVAVRLICPFTIESALSLIPSTQTIPMNIEMAAKPAIDSGVEAVISMVNPMIAASFTPNPAASVNPLQIWIPLAAVIWAFGMVLMFLYTAISYWRLNRRIDTAVRYRDNIFQSENVSPPFVLGIIKPKIYLPFQMNEQDLQHVVAHEQAHIRRKDHWWKPLGFLLLTIHWFNPLMWLAYVLLCRDIELACDEKVIDELNSEQRANYTQALVACSVNRRMISACPLAFGEVDVKERVRSIMKYRKPTFWINVVSTVACAIVAICFLTNPVEQDVVPGIYGSIDSSKWNITLEIDNVTPKGATIKLIQDGGYLPNRLFYGDDYNIEKYENSQWTAVEPLNDLVWATIAHTVPLDDSITWNINWANTFGELDAGLYRFCKSVSDHRAPGVTDHEVYTVEFIISDGESSGMRMLLAKVIDIHEGYFLVEPVEGSLELSSASRIEVPMKNMEPSPEPKVGDILEIEYDGQLQETYPARINNPYSIKIAESIRRLSLNDVIILSQKGYDLTWADFDQFEYIETGFGLYIRRYEINEQFHFSIGGAGPNSKPMYMHLGVNGEDPDAYIDIRDGGVTEFISAHKSDSSEEWDRIPMVMVNGELYLDTGKESTVMARCGMMDGEITSQVDGSKAPTIDNQSNFGTGYGYQYGPIEGTIEIKMNGKWWIFATEEARKGIQFPEDRDKEPQTDYNVDRTLTQEEIGTINAAFDPILYDKQGNPMSTNIWSCFFTSYYDDIRDMDFAEFLMYYPGDGSTVDRHEFDALRNQEDFWFKNAESLDNMPVPVHKLSARIVELTLKEYAGITLKDLDTSKVDYLAEYDAFYNYTSDYAPGIFQCTRGEIDGDLVRLYEETDNGTDILTLRKDGDRYLIVAHQQFTN